MCAQHQACRYSTRLVASVCYFSAPLFTVQTLPPFTIIFTTAPGPLGQCYNWEPSWLWTVTRGDVRCHVERSNVAKIAFQCLSRTISQMAWRLLTGIHLIASGLLVPVCCLVQGQPLSAFVRRSPDH